MEKCTFCGFRNNPAISDYTPDILEPEKFYYRCARCGRENVISQKKFFVDITGLKDEIKQTLQNRQQRAINTNILKDIDKDLQGQKWEMEREMRRRHPHAKTWGSNRINCMHLNQETKNGITYCKTCGQNLGSENIMGQDSFKSMDRQLDDIFTQEADILDYKAENPAGKGRPRKNPFMYRSELDEM